MLFSTYWEYRELILTLVKTNLKLRYRNSALGFLWSLIGPLAMFAVLIFVFMNIFRFQIPNYPAYLLTGIITWRFFASTAGSLKSIVSNANLLKKVYFPRHILVFSFCLFSLITSLLEFAVLVVVVAFLGAPIGPWLLLLPFLLALQFIFIYGVSLALSSIYVYFRDIENIWTIILQVGFYATPIIYPATILPEQYRIILHANPMSHFVIAMRYAVIYNSPPWVSFTDPAFGTIIGMIAFTLFSIAAGY
ncbi:MAG: ABC transporter permease, partial [Candidatus Micrarchaeota archaeon]